MTVHRLVRNIKEEICRGRRSKALQCTKGNSQMPYVWGTGGFHTACQESVNVAVLSLSTIPSTVRRVLFQPSGTMSLGISRVTSSLKCAPMSALNQLIPWILLQTWEEEVGLRTENPWRRTWNFYSTCIQYLWRHGKACPDILCPSCPPPIHQTTDQICSDNGTDPVHNQLFFDDSSNYVPSRSSIKCQSCKQSLLQHSSGCHRRTFNLFNHLFEPQYNACHI